MKNRLSSTSNTCIPETFVAEYVDQLLNFAKQLSDGSPMRTSALLRAEYIMDLVEAYRAKQPEVIISADTSQFIAQLDGMIKQLPELNAPRRHLGFISAKLHQVRQMFTLISKNHV